MPIIPVLAAIILAGAGATAVVADEAKPGDALYGIDQAMEQVQERLTFTPELKENLQLRLAGERLREYVGLQNATQNAPNEEVKTRFLALQEKLKERFNRRIERLEGRMEKLQNRLEDTDDPVVERRLSRLTERLSQVIEHQTGVVQKITEGRLPALRSKLGKAKENLKTHLKDRRALLERMQKAGRTIPPVLRERIRRDENILEKLGELDVDEEGTLPLPSIKPPSPQYLVEPPQQEPALDEEGPDEVISKIMPAPITSRDFDPGFHDPRWDKYLVPQGELPPVTPSTPKIANI